jgi:hypothetical protein
VATGVHLHRGGKVSEVADGGDTITDYAQIARASRPAGSINEPGPSDEEIRSRGIHRAPAWPLETWSLGRERPLRERDARVFMDSYDLHG